MIDKLLITPFQKFARMESFSGFLLMAATVVALIWANSPMLESYEAMRSYELGIKADGFKLVKPLILWVNDLLMAVFFFLIGLEIKRELLIGELNSPKKAAFPFFAAIGGMVFPVAVFILMNNDPATAKGWGIPMATDIAFTLAVLTILGKRVPLSLKVFITAFAIVDDLGAVMAIALFYSESIRWVLIAWAAGLLSILFIMSHYNRYSRHLLFAIGAVVWLLFLKAGIHPTIAGVLLALSVPIRRKIRIREYREQLSDLSEKIADSAEADQTLLSNNQIAYLDDLEYWTEKVQSPLQHLEHKLHGIVAYFIMPVFALFNAGVAISMDMEVNTGLVINITAALFIGKLIGINLMTYIGVKLGFAELPNDINYVQIAGISLLAGIGFTMSIFIGNLAFAGNTLLLDSAKIGILLGSFISGLSGYLVLRLAGNRKQAPQ